MLSPRSLLLVTFLVAGACATAPAAAIAQEPSGSEVSRASRDTDALTLTPEHFHATATTKRNARKATATVSTERGFVPRVPLRQAFSNDRFFADSYLSGVVQTATGEGSYRVVTRFTYRNAQHGYHSVDYGDPVRTRPLTRLVWQGTCGPAGCTYEEDVVFDLAEEELRAAAARYASEADGAWRFRMTRRSGDVYEGMLPLAEIVGFLRAVDAVNQRP